MFDMTIVLEAIIALALAVLTGLAIPYLKSVTTTAQQEQISTWVKVAVMAAEQLYASEEGAAKKSYVVDYLSAIGLTVDSTELDALIESAVYQLASEFEVMEEESYEPEAMLADQ